MKRLLIVFALLAPIVALASHPKAEPVIPKNVKAFLNGRRICVRRDVTTLPGYCISYWERNGKPDWKMPAVVTNRIHKVMGKEQMNPAQADAEKTRTIRKAKKNAAKKDAKSLEKFIKDTHKAMDKSSDEMRGVYQAVLDFLEEEDADE